MKRERDMYGNPMPSGSISGSLRSGIALPETMELHPIRIPRPRAEHNQPHIEDYPSAVGRFNYDVTEEHHSHFTEQVVSNNVIRQSRENIMASSLRNDDGSTSIRVRSQHGITNVPTSTDILQGTLTRSIGPVIPAQSVENILQSDPFASLDVPRIQTTVARSDDDPKKIKARALFKNYSLSYQRLCFSLFKFPALVLVFVSLWTMWGRGYKQQKAERIANEQNADIAALCTGGFVLVTYVLLISHHHNSYLKAKVMVYLYHLASIGALCGAIVSLIYGALAVNNIRGHQPHNVPVICTKNMQFKECLTYQERLTYQAVLVGTNSMLILFSLISLIFGVVAQSQFKSKLQDEYLIVSEHRTYTNQALQY